MSTLDPNPTPGVIEEPAPSFTRIAPYYDELMQDVPYGLWTRHVLDLARRHGSKPKRILDLACGTGTVTLMLHERGYDVVGIDGSAAMLEVAQQKAERTHGDITFIHADLATFAAPGKYDLALSLYDSLNNILEYERLVSAFERVALALLPGGLFIFDMNTEYALRANLFSQEHLDSDSRVQYKWTSHYDYSSRICTVDMQFWIR